MTEAERVKALAFGQGSAAVPQVVVVGAGPAGLTAAITLAERGATVTVLEKDVRPGGIARTESYKGYLFDIGGHRFFTKEPEVNALWQRWLGSEFLRRPRQSRIFYDGKFFHYPLRAFNALFGLGLWQSVQILASYVRVRLRPSPVEDTFEQWVSNRFGRRLYEIFFKTYTEKVWGIPCSEIRAEWAAQRIKGLSLPSAIRNALLPPKGEVIKTLIEAFDYPRRGPGQMWERVVTLVREAGQRVDFETDVVSLRHRDGRVVEVVASSHGAETVWPATDVISSMPLQELVLKLDPPPPGAIVAAARRLAYRDFLTVVLILDRETLFTDNWIYVHSSGVQVGRIQNFKNWSPEMVPDARTTSLGLEYFCQEGDALWTTADADLIALGARELEAIGLARADEVRDGAVVRQPKAYPIYDAEYGACLETIKAWLAGLSNLQTIGRNGLHKYNNQDHSMLTALRAVENIAGARHDLWTINTERSYHEEVRVPDERADDDAGPVDILDATASPSQSTASSSPSARTPRR
ncbi:MAG: NAD(P)/FAD-dependent oxidoreductase [Vicinamibacteraceae bacterium]